MKQKEQADKNCRKLLKEERRRLIKSATRRNPHAITDAIKTSKLVLKEHHAKNEWKSNQIIQRRRTDSSLSKFERIMTAESPASIRDYMDS